MMARTIGLRWGVGILAGILLPLLLMPIFGEYPLIEHFYILWPIAYYTTAGIVVVTALFWRIDGQSWPRSALATASIILILIHLSLIQILFMTILAPGMLAMGAGALMASKNSAELRAKVICAFFVIVALTAAGFFHYLYAIGLDTARHVFYQELIDFMNFERPNWRLILDDFSLLFMNPFTYDYNGLLNIDGILAPLSQLGAIYLAIFGRTRDARIFGRTVLIWVVATAATIAFLHNLYYYTGLIYQGPDARHFIPILWPYYAICLSSLIFALAEQGVVLLSRVWPAARGISTYVPHCLVILALAGPVLDRILTVIAPGLALVPQIILSDTPSFYSSKRNPIVDYLGSAIGVAIGHDFRGTAVTMPTVYQNDVIPYAPYRRETTFTYARAYMGNDLGMFGLQDFNIPTLDEETHNIAPPFYLVFRELLSRPGIDAYDKHYTLVSRLNEPIMELLGLRYIIADYELPFGEQRLAMPIPEEARAGLEQGHWLKSPVYVYELPHPNLGNYSPTHIAHSQTAKSTIDLMSDPTFDGRRTGITDDTSI
ncbi:MAG: hypothetical protein J2P31_17880, partial [Blastocatellia bacterium]|nr:hypothetical protein [Blastocatellia bacterium]